MSSGSLTDRGIRRIRLGRPSLRRLLTVRGLAVLAAVALVLVIGWVWFRGSSFVRIRQVTVTGLSGPDVAQIRRALTESAESMTVMNLSTGKLDRAVSAFPTVHSLTVSTHYPHSVTIAVNEQVPLAEVTTGGRLAAVDGDGAILPASTTHGLLPRLGVGSVAAGDVITGGGARAELRVLAAAPYRLIAHMRSVSVTAQHGVTVQLRNGPVLYFGPPSEVAAKWTAAIVVLADGSSHGASYIDVTDPRRPAAGA